ncbi:BQ5605_C054g12627 [Microbotryum silenes-dioicae]|uniref:BQ5605_C014g07430 protein n=1 Tax=Microbotryum silenes-dioicae TaxID=796604 RepID=A0A2X0NGC5_9BASI|nr:BQ5605_C014g07430 [Microbotryum silenes-dioicae]SGZ29354.1 BQ5605_C054g12627 [Microbotryum silenes-dioicae]
MITRLASVGSSLGSLRSAAVCDLFITGFLNFAAVPLILMERISPSSSHVAKL